LFLSDGSNELNLLAGDYIVTLADYSFGNEGDVYQMSGDECKFTIVVDADGEGEKSSDSILLNFNFKAEEIPSEDVTDSMINQVVEYMSNNESYKDKVSDYKDAVEKKREEALADKEEQELLDKKRSAAASAYEEVIDEYRQAQLDFKTLSSTDFLEKSYKYVDQVFMFDSYGPDCSYAYEDIDNDLISELLVCNSDGSLVFGVFDYNPDLNAISTSNEGAKYRYAFYYCGNGFFMVDADGGAFASDYRAYSYTDGAILNLVYELNYDCPDSTNKSYTVELYESGVPSNRTMTSQELQNTLASMNAKYPVYKLNGTAIK
jgi:hypothetical protein